MVALASVGHYGSKVLAVQVFSLTLTQICPTSMAMNGLVVKAVLLSLPCVPAPPGKSTIAASEAMQSLAFNLKYLPVTVAQDNGKGDMMSETYQGRVQTLLNNSYTERNCQLFATKGSVGSASKYYSMTPNGLGKDCTYSTGKQYTSGTELHKVFAYNKGQCCNACVATDGCVAASFLSSDKDQSGGFGPQTWEGFGIHISGASASKTTGGISVAELESRFRERFGDYSKYDQFMDYGVTFFTYDLQPYADAFKKDGVPFFLAQWNAEQTSDTWYSLFFLANASHYVMELTSARKPAVDVETVPQIEQRMSDDHVQKFKAYAAHPAHVLEISSINRATSNITRINDVYRPPSKSLTGHRARSSVQNFASRFSASSTPRNYVGRIDGSIRIQKETPPPSSDAYFGLGEHTLPLGNK